MNLKTKRLIIVISNLVILLVIVAVYYCSLYSIKTVNEDVIYTMIKESSEDAVPNKITIRSTKMVDNRLIVLITHEDSLGIVCLKKGINGKFRFDLWSLDDTGKIYKFRPYCIGDKDYFITAGKKSTPQAAYLEVTVGDVIYKTKIPDTEYFLVPIQIRDRNQSTGIPMVRLYDENYNEILE